MFRGIYTAASGMLVQQLRQEITGQNLTNLNTPAYKEQVPVIGSFPAVLLHRLDRDQRTWQPVGTAGLGTELDQVTTLWEQGSLVDTGNPANLALQGEGFLSVLVEGETRYTRQGDFHVDADGYLVTNQGHYLLGRRDPVWVGRGEFSVAADGGVVVDGATVDYLRLASFQPGQLVGEENGLYRPAAGVQPGLPGNDTRVRQGFLETSNTNVVRQMTSLLEASRAFEAGSRILQAYDEMLGKSVNEVGRLR